MYKKFKIPKNINKGRGPKGRVMAVLKDTCLKLFLFKDLVCVSFTVVLLPCS